MILYALVRNLTTQLTKLHSHTEHWRFVGVDNPQIFASKCCTFAVFMRSETKSHLGTYKRKVFKLWSIICYHIVFLSQGTSGILQLLSWQAKPMKALGIIEFSGVVVISLSWNSWLESHHKNFFLPSYKYAWWLLKQP